MVEVFKTDVTDRATASRLIDKLRAIFPLYQITFDLEDCDRILRIQSQHDSVNTSGVIDTLMRSGFHAELLQDGVQTNKES